MSERTKWKVTIDSGQLWFHLTVSFVFLARTSVSSTVCYKDHNIDTTTHSVTERRGYPAVTLPNSD